MPKHGKNYRNAAKTIDPDKTYELEEAIKLALGAGAAKFDQTVEMAIRLGVDPRQADQNVRGTVALPNGTGKSVRVLVIAKGEKVKEAQDAGADFVGGEELTKKIQEENWLEFDTVIATPDMMGAVGRLGKVLGPRGLMPNPKVGTVTFDVGTTVREVKAGKVEYRVEKAGIVHVAIGKVSFDPRKLVENATALVAALLRAKPSTAKGTYLKSVSVATTMGPGVAIDPASARMHAEAA